MEFTVELIEAMKEEKTPIARRITQIAKKRSQGLSGAMLLVEGVNCVRAQCIALTYESKKLASSISSRCIQLRSPLQTPIPYQQHAVTWFTARRRRR